MAPTTGRNATVARRMCVCVRVCPHCIVGAGLAAFTGNLELLLAGAGKGKKKKVLSLGVASSSLVTTPPVDSMVVLGPREAALPSLFYQMIR